MGEKTNQYKRKKDLIFRTLKKNKWENNKSRKSVFYVRLSKLE